MLTLQMMIQNASEALEDAGNALERAKWGVALWLATVRTCRQCIA
jgi:hypothetical protein